MSQISFGNADYAGKPKGGTRAKKIFDSGVVPLRAFRRPKSR